MFGSQRVQTIKLLCALNEQRWGLGEIQPAGDGGKRSKNWKPRINENDAIHRIGRLSYLHAKIGKISIRPASYFCRFPVQSAPSNPIDRSKESKKENEHFNRNNTKFLENYFPSKKKEKDMFHTHTHTNARRPSCLFLFGNFPL